MNVNKNSKRQNHAKNSVSQNDSDQCKDYGVYFTIKVVTVDDVVEGKTPEEIEYYLPNTFYKSSAAKVLVIEEQSHDKKNNEKIKDEKHKENSVTISTKGHILPADALLKSSKPKESAKSVPSSPEKNVINKKEHSVGQKRKTNDKIYTYTSKRQKHFNYTDISPKTYSSGNVSRISAINYERGNKSVKLKIDTKRSKQGAVLLETSRNKKFPKTVNAKESVEHHCLLQNKQRNRNNSRGQNIENIGVSKIWPETCTSNSENAYSAVTEITEQKQNSDQMQKRRIINSKLTGKSSSNNLSATKRDFKYVASNSAMYAWHINENSNFEIDSRKLLRGTLFEETISDEIDIEINDDECPYSLQNNLSGNNDNNSRFSKVTTTGTTQCQQNENISSSNTSDLYIISQEADFCKISSVMSLEMT